MREIDPDAPGDHPGETLSVRDRTIGNQILKEIDGRLRFLTNIGLDYVTMDRTARTLSGGEAQRVRLATQIGSGLTGVLYVCDEPTVGLHPHDDHRLIGTLKRLRDMGQHRDCRRTRRGHDARRRLQSLTSAPAPRARR